MNDGMTVGYNPFNSTTGTGDTNIGMSNCYYPYYPFNVPIYSQPYYYPIYLTDPLVYNELNLLRKEIQELKEQLKK